MSEHWQFGFHDNTSLGWLITAGYFMVVVMCCLAWRHPRAGITDSGLTWLLVGTGMLLLGINKQLDIQTWLQYTGRDITGQLGVYQHKIAIRSAFLVLLATCGLGAMLIWRRRCQSTVRHHPTLFAGLALLGVFILLSSLHPSQITRWDALPIARPEWHWVLEVGALLLVSCSAAAALAQTVNRR